MLGRGREPDNVRPVMGEHRLVPRDAQLQFRVALSYPVQHFHHPRAIIVVRDGREKLVERLDCHGFTLTAPMHICGTRGVGRLAFGPAPPLDVLMVAAGGSPGAATSSITTTSCVRSSQS